MPSVDVAIAFVETNLTFILFVLLVASLSFSLGLLAARRRGRGIYDPHPHIDVSYPGPPVAYSVGFAQGVESVRYNFVHPHAIRHLQHLLHRLKELLRKLKEWHDLGQLFFIPARGLLLFTLEELEEYFGREPWYRDIKTAAERSTTIEEIIAHAGHLATRLTGLI